MSDDTICTVMQKFKFDAAHYLPYHMGKCATMHGHSWTGIVFMRGKIGGHGCMVVDFTHIKRVLGEWVEKKLDHKVLNDSLPMESPTCEMLARWLFSKLKINLNGLSTTCKLVAVEIWESENSGARYEA